MPRFGLPIEDDEGDVMIKCPTCRGKGELFDSEDPDDWELLEKTGRTRVCPTCGGSREISDGTRP